MNERMPNPNDPEFLISRALDGDLSEEEQRALRALLSASPADQQAAESLKQIDTLLSEWGADPVEFDQAAFTRRVMASVASADAQNDDPALDEMLGRWATRRVDADWDAFTRDVMGRIETDAGGARGKWRRIAPLGLALAAAAAIAIAVVGPLWSPPVVTGPHTTQMVSQVFIGAHAVDASGGTASVVVRKVSFVQIASAGGVTGDSGLRGGTGYAGWAPVGHASPEEIPPL